MPWAGRALQPWGGLRSPCSASPGKTMLNPPLPAATAPALLLPCGVSSGAPPWCVTSRAAVFAALGTWWGAAARPQRGVEAGAELGPAKQGLCTKVPGARILPPLCSGERVCAVLVGRQSGCSVLKHPLSDTPLKLRDVPCTSVSPEFRAGLDETLLYPVVTSSLIIWLVLVGTQPKKGPYSAMHTCTHACL